MNEEKEKEFIKKYCLEYSSLNNGKLVWISEDTPTSVLAWIDSELKQQREKILKLIEIRGKAREIEGWADLLFDVEIWNLDNITLNAPEPTIKEN